MSQVVLNPESLRTCNNNSRWMVEIFNNNHNTFEEVIDVLMKSTGCGVEEAYIETWEAHHFGKAAVHFGSEQECREAARIINRVGVHTYVGREWIE